MWFMWWCVCGSCDGVCGSCGGVCGSCGGVYGSCGGVCGSCGGVCGSCGGVCGSLWLCCCPGGTWTSLALITALLTLTRRLSELATSARFPMESTVGFNTGSLW